jgi:hypothetical protein
VSAMFAASSAEINSSLIVALRLLLPVASLCLSRSVRSSGGTRRVMMFVWVIMLAIIAVLRYPTQVPAMSKRDGTGPTTWSPADIPPG